MYIVKISKSKIWVYRTHEKIKVLLLWNLIHYQIKAQLTGDEHLLCAKCCACLIMTCKMETGYPNFTEEETEALRP